VVWMSENVIATPAAVSTRDAKTASIHMAACCRRRMLTAPTYACLALGHRSPGPLAFRSVGQGRSNDAGKSMVPARS
jgi:hypothetical protein